MLLGQMEKDIISDSDTDYDGSFYFTNSPRIPTTIATFGLALRESTADITRKRILHRLKTLPVNLTVSISDLKPDLAYLDGLPGHSAMTDSTFGL